MYYIKRNTKFSISPFLSLAIILTLANHIQFLTKTEIHFYNGRQEAFRLPYLFLFLSNF